MAQNPTPRPAPEPVVLTTVKAEDREPEDRVTAFILDGHEYTIPANPKPSVGLRYLYEAKTLGPAQAEANMMAAVLGEEGFRALAYHDDLTQDQEQSIQAIVQFYVMGRAEGNR